MSARFSPVDAALEGLRVARREPWAVVYWVVVWALALAAIGTVKALGGGPVAHGTPRDTAGVIRSYGPLATILVPSLLALWVMNTATVYRAVLRPGEHGWHLFKLGIDEARIAVVSAAGTLLLIVFGGAPAFLLFVLFNPIFAAAPGLNWMIAFVGALTTVCLEIWIAVRFSLAPVETFAEQRFPLAAYWRLTRGSFWRLLASYLLVVLEIVVFLVIFALFGWVVGVVTELAIGWQGPDLARRLLLLTLVPVLAVMGAALLVGPSILICGAQAYAYRAIRGSPAAAPPA
ncbi:MAG TPA: hypothetical protein VGG29_15520 [Caulobacteraceae bacterium]